MYLSMTGYSRFTHYKTSLSCGNGQTWTSKVNRQQKTLETLCFQGLAVLFGYLLLLAVVPTEGFEPPHLAAHGPEPCASTNSATWAICTSDIIFAIRKIEQRQIYIQFLLIRKCKTAIIA